MRYFKIGTLRSITKNIGIVTSTTACLNYLFVPVTNIFTVYPRNNLFTRNAQRTLKLFKYPYFIRYKIIFC